MSSHFFAIEALRETSYYAAENELGLYSPNKLIIPANNYARSEFFVAKQVFGEEKCIRAQQTDFSESQPKSWHTHKKDHPFARPF